MRESAGATMAIDQATRGNLELMRTLGGERRGSLLDAIDRTVTSAGSRLLAQRLAAPLTDPAAIGAAARRGCALSSRKPRRAPTRARELQAAPDLARALARLALGRGGPRDLAAIRDGILAAADLARALASLKDTPAEIAEALEACRAAGSGMLAAELAGALADELPAVQARRRLRARRLRPDARRDAGACATNRAGSSPRCRRATPRRPASRALKIRHNNVLGYFVEVTAQHGDKLLAAPLNATFIHRQTLAGQVRFTTDRARRTGGQDRQRRRPRARPGAGDFRAADRRRARRRALAIKACAEALAALDVASALAACSPPSATTCARRSTTRLAFTIEGGRHPVVEQALSRDGTPFVANDCDLSPPLLAAEDGAAGRIWLLTGPNMAGKSTFLRQNALIAILAQMGSFVPATRAHIGVVDRLFSRVGAADDLARGRSTFMVEMVETAAILNQAGARALVILDEIGRGTATFDGLSIAWATIEHLHDANNCRALFATHFHELTALAARLPRLHNATVRVKEWQGEVVFLHEVTAGAADRSYGIQVAKLAGLPASVIERAKIVLAKLEAEDRAGAEGLRRPAAVRRAAARRATDRGRAR